LVDGNERLALAATIALLGLDGRRRSLSNVHAYQLVMSVAAGELDDVTDVAVRVRRGTEPR
jgi:death-on-curing protein